MKQHFKNRKNLTARVNIMPYSTFNKKAVKRKKNRAGHQNKILNACVALSACFLFPALMNTGLRHLSHSTLLKVTTINITGCNHTDRNALIQTSGIKKGDNILSMDLKDKSRMLEKNPLIYKAVVKRQLPNTIEIQIEERKPVAVIKLDDFYLLDTHGEIFNKIERHEKNLPLLTGISKTDLINNRDRSLHVISSAVILAENLLNKNIPGICASTIRMDSSLGLTIVNSVNNTETYMGFGNYEDKLERLKKITFDLTEKGLLAETINLNSINKAYVKLNIS